MHLNYHPVSKSSDNVCYEFKWETAGLLSNRDCVDIDSGGALWFGGAEEFNQHFPLRKSNRRAEVPFVTGDMIQGGNSIDIKISGQKSGQNWGQFFGHYFEPPV